MKNYKIEGNIDFFAELYKSLDIEDEDEHANENICLITNQPLTENFVKMECGHTFNYTPLFHDIKNHKQKYNNLEGSHSRLHSYEIRCPYCRNKQKKLLPYYPELGLEKTHGVNYYDSDKKACVTKFYGKTYNICQYLTPIPLLDTSGNPVLDASGNEIKHTKCYSYGYWKISDYIIGYEGEDICVCFSHKNKMIKDHKKMLKDKEKLEVKKAKEEAKANAKKEKEEAKAKAKADKKQEKKNANANAENIIVNSSIVIHVDPIEDHCASILKTGPNKGKKCESKLFHGAFCKRHYKELITKIDCIIKHFDAGNEVTANEVVKNEVVKNEVIEPTSDPEL